MKKEILKDRIGWVAAAMAIMVGITIYSYTWEAHDIIEFKNGGYEWTSAFLWCTIILFIACIASAWALWDLHKMTDNKHSWHNWLFWLGSISGWANGIICIIFWIDGPENLFNDYSLVHILSICGGIPMWISAAMAIWGYFEIDHLSTKYKTVNKSNNIEPDAERTVEFLRFKALTIEADNNDLVYYRRLKEGLFVDSAKKIELRISNQKLLDEAKRLKTKYPGTKVVGIKDFSVLINTFTARSKLIDK